MKNFNRRGFLFLPLLIFVSNCSLFSGGMLNEPVQKPTEVPIEQATEFLKNLEGEWFSYVAATNQGSKMVISGTQITFFKVNGYGSMPVTIEGKTSATEIFLSVGNKLLAYTLSENKQILTLNTSNISDSLRVASPTVYSRKLKQTPLPKSTWVSHDDSIRASFNGNYFKLEKKVFGMYFDAVDGEYQAYENTLLLTTQHIRDESANWISDTQYHGAEYSFIGNQLTITFEKAISADLEISGSLVMKKK